MLLLIEFSMIFRKLVTSSAVSIPPKSGGGRIRQRYGTNRFVCGKTRRLWRDLRQHIKHSNPTSGWSITFTPSPRPEPTV